MRHNPASFIEEPSCSTVSRRDTIDCEALTGGLCGAYPAVVHILILDVNVVLCFFMGMIFVGAELFPAISFGLADFVSLGSRRTSRADHGFSGVADAIG